MAKKGTCAEWWAEKVDFSGDCWLWTGYKSPKGYGSFGLNGRSRPAHRVTWILYRGEIPKGLLVLHKCDVRHCVNPCHLYLGTAHDNNQDTIRSGHHQSLQKTHCPQGHPYDEGNTYIDRRGFRYCRICSKGYTQARQTPEWRLSYKPRRLELSASKESSNDN